MRTRSGETSETGDETGEPELPEVRSEEPHDDDPQLDESERAQLAAANHALSLDLYHALREGQTKDKGFALSAYSIQTAFGMVYAGTVEPARAEIESTLHFSLADERQHVGFNWLDAPARRPQHARGGRRRGQGRPGHHRDRQRPMGAREHGPGPSAPLPRPALDPLRHRRLPGRLRRPAGGRARAHQRLGVRAHPRPDPRALPGRTINDSTTLVLANAFYLKAPWANAFEESSTTSQPFTRLDGTQVMVDMMAAYELTGQYGQGAGWVAVGLPLRGQALDVVAIMPEDFTAFEAGLDDATLDSVLGSMEGALLQVELPRFELSTDVTLNGELAELGMPTVFGNSAVFDDIVPGGPGVITTVIHKTVISVDEKGTEAAAATGIVFGDDGSPGIDYQVRIDRPFFLVIRDQPTNTLLFFGRVLDPTAG
ncbi:MAG: serpin family protein [Deltaproteobacteria bacterium]|nr:serpin family protein [Deltaproteobacteria bacterium]